MTKKRLPRTVPADRKAELLAAAVRVASKLGGWAALSRPAVAQEAGCCDSLVSAYFGTMPQFRRAVMREAIRVEALPVIAQGLACGDSCAQKVDPALKLKALITLQ